jgi:hypothetical protein
MIKKCLLILSLFVILKVYAQTDDKCVQVLKLLDKVKNACEAYPPSDYCNIFVGEAVQEIYGIDDFADAGSATGYRSANAIADLLLTNNKWTLIGTCKKQDILDAAQNDANSNRCVIAVWKNGSGNSAHGHISIILPGALKTGWNGMMVPNAANFSLGTDQHNFVCDRLSGAFSYDKRNSVFLYVHND